MSSRGTPLVPAAVVLAAALLAAAGCGGSSGPTGPGIGTDTDPITAVVNGAEWSASYTAHAAVTPGALTLSGSDREPVTVTIVLPGEARAGTFALGFLNANGALATVADSAGVWSTGYAGGTGSITVAELDSVHVTGTFDFTAAPAAGNASADTLRVTGGEFDIPF